MKLLTKYQRMRLIQNGRKNAARICAGHDTIDFPPVVKLFAPDANCTWLLVELDAEGNTAFGLCDLGMDTPELGYVQLSDIASVRGRLGLPIERDLYFSGDKPLSEYAREARSRGHIKA